jgi:uncharacterized protein
MNRKTNQSWRKMSVVCLASILLMPIVGNAQAELVSQLGQYSGYSNSIYNRWVRTSQYVSVRDGTQLAVDIIRPAKNNGIVVEDPLPVIWTHDRYQRALYGSSNNLLTQMNNYPWLETVLRYGYVIAVVDIRGGGASYGIHTGPFSKEETQDAYDITEWLASQPWSDGRIGMYGRSYLGITQYMAASTAPPHLVAIFPEMAMFDLYSFVYPGGVYQHNFLSEWGNNVEELDRSISRTVVPVDEDHDATMLEEALLEHLANTDIYEWSANAPHRNSIVENEVMDYFQNSPSTYIEDVNKSGVAIYHLGGWYDIFTRDALLWFSNLESQAPQKLVIGPWSHSGGMDQALGAEHLRWYDFWLKGIDNGVMEEPPIYYYTIGAPTGQEWRSTWQWPLPNQQSTKYYFHGGPSNSVHSINDGLLILQAPTNPTGVDTYVVDYSTTTGTATRWTNGYGGSFDYPDMTVNDAKGLTYTTSPLTDDVEVTGHPIVHLWVTSTASDGDFFVYLEEVDEPKGSRIPAMYSHYVTEGTLRASHRATAVPAYEYLDLPYHRSFSEDTNELPINEPVELIFDLHPTSNIFDKGHRIRITVTCADKDNMETPESSPVPTVSVYRNTVFSSYVILPIIPTGLE